MKKRIIILLLIITTIFSQQVNAEDIDHELLKGAFIESMLDHISNVVSKHEGAHNPPYANETMTFKLPEMLLLDFNVKWENQ